MCLPEGVFVLSRVPKASLFFIMASFISVFLFFLSFFQVVLTAKVPDVEYDVIVVGGGPGGLSAVSALSRVARKVIMFDHEEYRNARTRNMHDVLGNDGKKPCT